MWSDLYLLARLMGVLFKSAFAWWFKLAYAWRLVGVSLFSCLLAIHVSFSVRCVLIAGVCVYMCWVVFFFFICWCSLYILDTNPLLYVVPFFLPSLLFFFPCVFVLFCFVSPDLVLLHEMLEWGHNNASPLDAPWLGTSVSISVRKPRFLSVLSLEVGRAEFPSTSCICFSPAVWVSGSCCNKMPWTGWLKTTEMYFVTVQEARSLKWRCWQRCSLLEALKESLSVPLS